LQWRKSRDVSERQIKWHRKRRSTNLKGNDIDSELQQIDGGWNVQMLCYVQDSLLENDLSQMSGFFGTVSTYTTWKGSAIIQGIPAGMQNMAVVVEGHRNGLLD
jgi:hypothetical protein